MNYKILIVQHKINNIQYIQGGLKWTAVLISGRFGIFLEMIV